MKIAIVHDALVNLGGAERVLSVFHEIFPEAPIYTSVYLPEHTHASLRAAQIHTTFLQKMAKTERQLKLLFPLAFVAMRFLDLSACDIVLTSSTHCAKNVDTSPPTTHVCYCYAPFRPIWEFDQYTANLDWNYVTKLLMRGVFAQYRSIDFKAGQKPKYIVAISKHAARKIQRAYGRKPNAIIYPSVDVGAYRCDVESENYFMVVSRLLPYKRVDIVIKAFNTLKIPLKVIGAGRDLARLRGMSEPNIQFLGAVSERDLCDYYARCRCLVFPGEEDFGLSPLEAHASGKPVIAFGGGGALETIVGVNSAVADSDAAGATGLFFRQQTPEAVVEAVRQFEKLSFDHRRIRERALLFDKVRFKSRIREFLTQVHNNLVIPEMWMGADSEKTALIPEPTQPRAPAP